MGGRTQGQMAINRVVGPRATIAGLYTRYGDVCRARENVVSLTFTETDCSTSTANAWTLTMKNVVITQVGFAVAAQDMIVNDNTTMMFASLEIDGD